LCFDGFGPEQQTHGGRLQKNADRPSRSASITELEG